MNSQPYIRLRRAAKSDFFNIIVQILETIIFPIFIVIGIGFAFRRVTGTETESFSSIVLHIFSPCLVFSSIVSSSFSGSDWWKLSIIAIASTILLVIIASTVARLLHLGRQTSTAFTLSISFVNAGNYGLPLCLLAFGTRGLELAVIFFILSSILMFTLGVLIACNTKGGFKEAISSVARLPLIYAVLLAIGVKLSSIGLPDSILQGVNIISQAAVPAMLIVLGMELAKTDFHEYSTNWKLVSLSTVMRLLLPIILVSILAEAIELGGLARSVTLIQASMPTAVFIVIIAIKYGGDSHFVTGNVALSTLASILTLTILLSYLL